MAQPVDFGFGEDEALLRDQARRFLDEHASTESVRKLVGSDPEQVYARGELPGFDGEIWRRCVELGWTALAVPEEQGGIGAKAVAVAALAEEVGRHAFPSPLISTLMATYVLRKTGAHGLLARVADGLTISLALTNERGDWALDASEVRAQPSGQGFVLEGTSYFVQDAYKVNGYLVAAHAPDGLGLFMIDKTAEGVRLERDHIVDLTRDQGRVVFSGAQVSADHVVARPGEALGVLERAWPMVLVLVSADLVGSAEWQLQTTVEYAKVRRQFERTIGFFQAVKHPLVDAMMAIDRARSLLYNAACASDTEPERAELYARMAKSAASDAAVFTSGRAVQLHGGIGFTWECDLQLFFKRSRHNAALYGDGVHQRKRLAELLMGALP